MGKLALAYLGLEPDQGWSAGMHPLLRLLTMKRGYSMIKLGPFNDDADFKDNDPICYCFNYTKAEIEKDYIDHGRSTILEKIALANRNGGCDCTQKNPKRS
ncbi:hypothetical protein [Syntrophus gentianae]